MDSVGEGELRFAAQRVQDSGLAASFIVAVFVTRTCQRSAIVGVSHSGQFDGFESVVGVVVVGLGRDQVTNTVSGARSIQDLGDDKGVLRSVKADRNGCFGLLHFGNGTVFVVELRLREGFGDAAGARCSFGRRVIDDFTTGDVFTAIDVAEGIIIRSHIDRLDIEDTDKVTLGGFHVRQIGALDIGAAVGIVGRFGANSDKVAIEVGTGQANF